MSSGYQEPVGGTSSPSSGTAIGSKPIRAILRMFRNIDIAADTVDYGSTFIPVLKTPFYHKADTFFLQNPAQTFSTGFESAAIPNNQTIQIPQITRDQSGAKKDEATLNEQTQVLKNKEISITLNTVKDVLADATYYAGFNGSGVLTRVLLSTLPAGGTPADNSITDAKIAAHTSTKITITAKGQLNSSIVYTDQANTYGDFLQTIRSSRLKIMNPANTFGYIYVGAALAANRNINWPLLTGDDEPLFKDFAATVTNKSMSGSSNTFTNLGDSAISSHTSTKITITTKGQLNSSILYGDQNNSFGAFYHDIGEIAAPAAPGANLLRVYMDSGDESLRVKNSSNTVFNLFSPTGLVDANIGSHTSTKITITAKGQLNSSIAYIDQANTYGDFDQKVRSGRLWLANPANTFHYKWVGAAIAAARNINLPLLTGDDEPLFKDFAATVTNKSMSGSSNTFTNLGDSAISSHTSTKITITAKGQLNSAILYNDVDNALGAHYYDITEMAAPASPGAGVLRIYANSTTHELTQRDSSGAEKKFSDGSGGGGGNLDSLSDVVISSPSTGQVIKYNGSNWINDTDATGGGGAALDDITDVTITSIAANQAIVRNSGNTAYINALIADANITAHTSTKVTITAKGQLNSQIAYKDETDWITNSHVADGTLNWSKVSKSGSIYDDLGDVVITSAASQDIIHRNGSSQWVNLAKGSNNTFLGVNGSGSLAYSTVADANIASHTSTKITITAKGQLNSQIAYKDENTWLTDAMVSGSAAIAVTKIAASGTNGWVLKTVAGTPTWAAESGGTGLAGQLTYMFIIYKDGSNYKAFNTATLAVDFTNTEPGTVFNSVINAMNAAGGGIAFVKNAVYPCTSTITTKDNTGFVGESRHKTILRNNQTTSQLLKYASGAASFLTNFLLLNLCMEAGNVNGNGTGASDTHWYSSGATNVVLWNCLFKTFAAPSSAAIQVFFDTFSNANDNTNIQVNFCEFTGPAAGEDYFGCGRMVNCDWSHNYVHDVTAQGIGIGASRRSLYNDNRFVTVGTNAIGFENDCQDNLVSANVLWNTGGIKLSQEGSTATNISRNNKVFGNHISYGLGGVEDGIAIGDDISNNTFYRCERNGIRGSFSGCRLHNNTFTDGNWGFYTQTINSISNRVGGIICLNNPTPLPTNDYNSIENNTFVNTNVTFTDPVSSSTNEEGDMCGIILDTNYRYTALNNNNGQNLDVATVIDYSTNKLTNGGWYTIPEDNIFVMDERILKLKGSDNNPITWLESTGQTAPNQSFDFLANYTKQGSATNVPASFGYQSDIYSWEWWSKAGAGGNKMFFGIDAINDKLTFDGFSDFKDNHLQLTKLASDPAGNPPADNVWLYVRNSDEHVVIENDAGTQIDIQAGGGGGAPTGASYVTLGTDGTLSAERVLTAGPGMKFVDAGAGNNLTIAVSPLELAKKWIVFQTDFIHPMEGDDNIPFDDTVSGTGAAASPQATTSATEQGIYLLTTGTTATGRAAINMGANSGRWNTILLGGGEITFIAKVKFSNVSDGTHTYAFRCGLLDSATGEATNGVYFIHDSTNANWRIMARAAGAGSASNSASAVDTSWHWIKIIINAAGTSASFYLDGTLLATTNTISSGLPTAGTSIGISIIKSASTTARTVTVDFVGCYQELTTARVF